MVEKMRLEHDKKADAVYIYLSDAPYAYGKDLDTERRIDYSSDGTPLGIELVCVSEGVLLSGLPQPKEIARLLKTKNIKVVLTQKERAVREPDTLYKP